MFHAAELLGQDERLFLTEPCRSPIPTSLARSDPRCPLSRSRPTRDRPAAEPPQSIGFRLPGRFRVCARQIDPAKLKMRVPYLGLHFHIRFESERQGYTD